MCAMTQYGVALKEEVVDATLIPINKRTTIFNMTAPRSLVHLGTEKA